mmetsp:Transcript_16184/g.24407  ORF Transcript_16184/g.24407 Transcript_16184/m.24407 type:complete len:219 (+) Transcript_16184:14-670(+)|eukprot:CAMPEP_0167762420 /NCGR_PEP_ID=MMETSP0110_2-20121227/12757_1 /TAXON_ID=629695 /ORGANISM="Gymnochlora sp., Strain CCMP2014" /LENGTH=218 /DNA_ID=CAMNT_0007649291 /DNA_START=12 /DNA_END=668 /DNA_ORIENTATION=+
MGDEVSPVESTDKFCVADIDNLDLSLGDGREKHMSEEMKHILSGEGNELPDMDIDPVNERFPFCIVWGPLPCITWLFPVIGHMGIGDSRGRVHDFAGPYTVNTGRFMTGRVVRYYQLRKEQMMVLAEKGGGDAARYWDIAIAEGDRKYEGLMHNICCQNCHHHSAECMTKAGFKKIGMVSIALLVICQGKNVSLDRTLLAFTPFFMILAFIIVMTLLV